MFDSLPYIDYQDADYEAYALSLVEHEMSHGEGLREEHCVRLRTNKSDADLLKNAPLLKARYMELKDARSRGEDNVYANFSEANQVIHAPTDDDVMSWDNALMLAKIKLEMERNRALHLELQTSELCEDWKYFLKTKVEQDLSRLKNFVVEKRIEVDRINGKRKTMQEEAVDNIQNLDRKWESLVDKRFRLLNACNEIEHDIKKSRVMP